MKNEVLAERLRFFKETEEGQEELSEVDARSVARGEIRGEAKGFAKGELSIITKLILTNKVPLELLAATSGLSVDELKNILAQRQQESHYYTQEEVKERLHNLVASWK